MTIPSQQQTSFGEYLSGKKLYGDDFPQEYIEEWYRDEEEGYASLQPECSDDYEYVYHELNRRHGFSRLGSKMYRHALGIGAAYGEEFRPVARQIERITILDPSEKFKVGQIGGVPVEYRQPSISGKIPFDDCQFDLATCFGVLHHIPNVSFVVAELGRVLEPGGIVLIREPVVSMGDWRKPRPGLTKRERGIPHRIMEAALDKAGFVTLARIPCMTPIVARMGRFAAKGQPFNSKVAVLTDEILSRALLWNLSYERKSAVKKLAPSSMFWVAKRGGR